MRSSFLFNEIIYSSLRSTTREEHNMTLYSLGTHHNRRIVHSVENMSCNTMYNYVLYFSCETL